MGLRSIPPKTACKDDTIPHPIRKIPGPIPPYKKRPTSGLAVNLLGIQLGDSGFDTGAMQQRQQSTYKPKQFITQDKKKKRPPKVVPQNIDYTVIEMHPDGDGSLQVAGYRTIEMYPNKDGGLQVILELKHTEYLSDRFKRIYRMGGDGVYDIYHTIDVYYKKEKAGLSLRTHGDILDLLIRKEVEEKKGEGEILFGSEIELLPEVVYGYLDIELRSMMTIVADYSGILERDEKKMMGAVRGLQRAAEQKKLNIDVIGMYQNLKEGYSARKVANEPYTINPVWAMNNWCLDNLKRTIESKLEQKRLEK